MTDKGWPDNDGPGTDLRVFHGGTFDPVHEGHLAIARAARDALDCTIRMMPAADPPHRRPPGASAADRAEMLRLAIDGETGLCLDLRELERDGPSYSAETLRGIREEVGPGTPVALLLGADSFLGLPQWREWQALFGLAHFVVASRPGSPLDVPPPQLAEALLGREVATVDGLRSASAGRVLYLHQPLQLQSATAIRHRIATGQAWRSLLPAAVADYIVTNGLYGAKRTPGQQGPVIGQ